MTIWKKFEEICLCDSAVAFEFASTYWVKLRNVSFLTDVPIGHLQNVPYQDRYCYGKPAQCNVPYLTEV